MLVKQSIFGTRTRTGVLLALRLLGESYPRELARVLGTTLSGVQQALHRLELEGVVAGRLMGRTRLYRISPRYFAAGDLEMYLLRLAEGEMDLKARVESMRRRPRRTGKPL